MHRRSANKVQTRKKTVYLKSHVHKVECNSMFCSYVYIVPCMPVLRKDDCMLQGCLSSVDFPRHCRCAYRPGALGRSQKHIRSRTSIHPISVDGIRVAMFCGRMCFQEAYDCHPQLVTSSKGEHTDFWISSMYMPTRGSRLVLYVLNNV